MCVGAMNRGYGNVLGHSEPIGIDAGVSLLSLTVSLLVYTS